MKRVILALLTFLYTVPALAEKSVKPLPRTLRNYPSGAIDEYHFRPGHVVVRGSVKNVPAGTYGTLSLTGQNIFTEQDFVETIAVDGTGHFCTSVLVPHTQFFTLAGAKVFAAVGDTLDITITGNAETGSVTAAYPQITDPLVAHHVVDAYRRFVIEKEGRRPEPSLSPEGDAIFNALVDRYKGNVLVIDFWGIGCAPCRAGMLGQRADVEYFKDKPVRFLYICNEKDSPREHGERFMNDNHIKGEHIYLTPDEWNHLAKKFRFIGIPFHLTVNKKGKIVSNNYAGRHTIEELVKE